MKTVLITGASSGIGYEFSHIFGKYYYRVILVSRDRERLRAIQKELHEKYGIEVVIIPKDLSLPSSTQEIFDMIKKENIDVDVLINNAGFGNLGKFSESDLKKELEMINVNISALTALTRLFLPEMIAKNHGKILNVASTAAFQPGPMMSVYYATKAYVLSFSEALSEELKGTGVTVTALCPGPTASNFQKTAGIQETKLIKGKRIATSKEVAEFGYDAMMKGKRIAVQGTMNKLMAYGVKFLPRRLVTRTVKKMHEK